ncbi:ABC transporter permease [Leucobacter sp. CSA2]|uniref:ABC transporter permease n=1 Tax=Leucobacter edaphi TaxID=2796472 RepID=A0A934QEE7_9MICO|nr:ABC transporter permease [Leucobacter edaphi]MBK0421582.1 ABC transporter permease [Leucobacter edaphi]
MFGDMLGFLADGANWIGSDGILSRLLEHLGISALSVLIAAVIAIPIGILIGHTGRGVTLAVGAMNTLRALPSLGVMTLLALFIGLGLIPPVIALVALAIPPLLAGVTSGFRSVDPTTVDAARAMGMREGQIITQVELPLAVPLIAAGFRNAALQVIATATIAAYVNLGGLGRYIFDGLAVYDYGSMLVGAVLVSMLALIVDGTLAGLGAIAAPRTGRRSRRSGRT